MKATKKINVVTHKDIVTRNTVSILNNILMLKFAEYILIFLLFIINKQTANTNLTQY